jgi:hypothetical protein
MLRGGAELDLSPFSPARRLTGAWQDERNVV